VRNILSLYLTEWSVDLARRRLARSISTPTPTSPTPTPTPPATARHAERLLSTLRVSPLLLAHRDGQRQLVAHRCPRCADVGVRPGMTVAEARALLPPPADDRERADLAELQRRAGEEHPAGAPGLVLEHDHRRDRRALVALAHWAVRFSPIVQPDQPTDDDPTFGLLLDITGCERLFHGERRHLNAVANAVEWMGFASRAAIAPTPVMARAAARFGPLERCIVRPERLDAALDALPVSALRFSAAAEDALRELGVETVGELRAIPRLALPARFGDELLHRLDAATGAAPEPLDPVKPAPPPVVERAFAGPTKNPEAVRITVDDLLDELCCDLLHRQQGALRLETELVRSDAPPVGFELVLSSPSRNAKHLRSLARPRVEKANLGFGVERIVVHARRVMKLPHQQHARWRDDRAHAAEQRRLFGELIDTLAVRLGPERVTLLRSSESHDPERAHQHMPALGAFADQRDADADEHAPHRQRTLGSWVARRPNRASARAGDRADFDRAHPADRDGAAGPWRDRPTVLFARPEPAEVVATTPDGPPRTLRWRGERHHVAAAAGPERIVEEWWRRAEESSARGARTGHGHRDGGDADLLAAVAPPSLEHEAARARVLDATKAMTDAAGFGESGCRPNAGSECEIDWEAEAAAVALTGADYFRVQLPSGLWLWIARVVHTSNWFVRGVWA